MYVQVLKFLFCIAPLAVHQQWHAVSAPLLMVSRVTQWITGGMDLCMGSTSCHHQCSPWDKSHTWDGGGMFQLAVSTMCWHSLHCRCVRETDAAENREMSSFELTMYLGGLMVRMCWCICLFSIFFWPTTLIFFAFLASLLSQMMQNSPLGGGPIGKDIVPSLGHCHSNQLPVSAAVSNSSHCRNYWGAPLC